MVEPPKSHKIRFFALSCDRELFAVGRTPPSVKKACTGHKQHGPFTQTAVKEVVAAGNGKEAKDLQTHYRNYEPLDCLGKKR